MKRKTIKPIEFHPPKRAIRKMRIKNNTIASGRGIYINQKDGSIWQIK